MEISQLRAWIKSLAPKMLRYLQLHLLLRPMLSLIQFTDLLGHHLFQIQIYTQMLFLKNNKEEKYQENFPLKLKLFLILSNQLEQPNKLLELNSLVLMILKNRKNLNLIVIMAQFIISQKMMKRTKIQSKQENQLNMLKNNYNTDFSSMQKKKESTIRHYQMDSSAREKQTLKKVTTKKLDQMWIEKRKRNFKERKKKSLKKRDRKLSKSYKKNSKDKQPKKLKLKSKQQSLPKRRRIFKKDSSIFNLKHLKKSNKSLMIKITELICF